MVRSFRYFQYVLSLCLVLFITPSYANDANVYQIGAILPLSGAGANYGKWEKQGIELAVDEINQTGIIAGKNLVVIFEDSRSLPKDGVAAMTKLATVNKVPVVIAGISSVVLACAPIADQQRVVLLNSGGVSPKIRGAGKYVFSNIGDGALEVRIMAEYAYNTLRKRRIGILFINAAAGTDSRDVFRERFTKLGGKIVDVEGHEQGATDFRAQLIKLKAAKPDAIYLASFTKESALILKQAKELDLKTQWLSYAPFEGEDIIDIAGNAADGVIYTSPAFDPNSSDQHIQDFQKRYEARFGVKAELYAATFYDGIKIIADAIKKGGYSGDGIRKALAETQNYPGVSGLTSFESDGAVSKPVIMKTVKDGSFQLYSQKIFLPAS